MLSNNLISNTPMRFPTIITSENSPGCVWVCGCVGVLGEGDTMALPLAHGLTVLKTPIPNASRDSLRFRTICAEMKVQLATPATSSTGGIDWVPQILRGNDWIPQNTGVRQNNIRNGSYGPPYLSHEGSEINYG